MKTSSRLVAALCVFTALATGWQIFQTMMWGVWGRPSNPLDYVGLAGAVVLCAGGIVLYEDRKAGGAIGAAGCLALWIFYGPGVWNFIVAVADGRANPSQLAFLPPVMLWGSTVFCAFVVLMKEQKRDAPEGAQTDNERAGE